MKKDELIDILKRLLREEDIDFLHKLDEDDLVKLVMFIREKIGPPKGMHWTRFRQQTARNQKD